MVKHCRGRGRTWGRVLRRRRCTCGESLNRDVLEIISHEFRTPLTGLKGFLQVLMRAGGAADSAAQAGILQMMHDNVEELRYLVDKVVLAARLEADQAPAPGPVNLSVIAVEALGWFSRPLRERGTAVRLDLPPVLGPVWGEAYYLRQMIAQLIGNSIKYAPASSVLTITGRDTQTTAVLVVADEGGGPSTSRAGGADLNRLLLPFARGEAPGRGAHPGGGLGLYIVRRIVERHGGSLAVHGQTDEGLAVEIRLPKAPASSMAWGNEGGAAFVLAAEGPCGR